MRLANVTVQQIIDALPEPVQIVNPDFTVDTSNSTMRGSFPDGQKTYCYEKFGRNEPCSGCPMRQVIANNGAESLTVVGQDGKAYSAILLPLGTPEGAVIETVRPTGNGRLADEAEVLKEQTEFYADKISTLTKSFFGMAHNLKNPLTAIQGKIQIFGMRHPEFKTEVDALVGQCDVINNMLSEMNLKFKLEQNTEVMPIDLNDVIENEIRFLSLDLNVKHKINKVFRPGERLSPVMAVYSDLSLVFNNLLMNAIEAVQLSERKDVTVTTAMEDGFVTATVEDTGRGIQDKDLSKLFMPFYQVAEENGCGGEGKGLGLFIAYQLVQRYRGDISVESTFGVGTKFTVRFPNH